MNLEALQRSIAELKEKQEEREARKIETKDGEVVEEEKFDEFESAAEADGSDLEQDLTDALNLLEDCQQLFEPLLQNWKIPYGVRREMEKVALDVTLFLNQWNGKQI